jgi:CubicO group peptidase (beta-lactamase class C family)
MLKAQLPALSSKDFSEAKLDAYVIGKRIMDLTNLPGMAISVSYKGDLVYEEGFGYEDMENGIYVRPDTSIFRLADISKSITSVMLMKAVEKNKLNLDAPVSEFIDYFPNKKYAININQLACHTAGIRPLEPDEKVIDRNYNSLKKSISLFKKDRLLFKPETEFLYSDHSWTLIGACIENAYGYDFQRVIQDQLIDEMGIKNMYLEGFENEITNLSKFYTHDQSSDIQYAEPANYSHVSPGMAFVSTSNALVKFANELLLSTYLSDSSKQRMLKPCTLKNGKQLDYSLGWMVKKDDEGRQWFGHSGSGVGASSMLLIYPEYEIVVVVLLNLTEAKTRDLPFKIANQFIKVIDSQK